MRPNLRGTSSKSNAITRHVLCQRFALANVLLRPVGQAFHLRTGTLRRPRKLLPVSVASLLVENFLTRVLPWRRVASSSAKILIRPRSRTDTTRLKFRQWEHLILTSYLQPTSLFASFAGCASIPPPEPTGGWLSLSILFKWRRAFAGAMCTFE